METRANYVLIGALLILSAVIMAMFALWLGQSEYRRDYKAYDIVFEGPVSLEEGSAVRYIGIKVGEVASVRVDRADPAKVRARIRVSREAPIREDSSASIQLAGITGTTFIQISAGTGDRLEARPGEPVPVIRSERTLVDQIVAGGAQALGRANMTFEKINKVLTDENIAAFSATLINIEAATSRIADSGGLIDQLSIAASDVSRAALAFEEASRELGSFSNGANENVSALTGDMAQLIADLRDLTHSAGATLERSAETASVASDVMEGQVQQTLRATELASRELRVTLSRFDRLIREIEANPQSLLVGESLPYEEAP